MDKENYPELTQQLKKLNDTLMYANSYKTTLFRGIILGLGSALGATFVAAVVITVIIELLSSAGGIPVLSGIISTLNLTEVALPTN